MQRLPESLPRLLRAAAAASGPPRPSTAPVEVLEPPWRRHRHYSSCVPPRGRAATDPRTLERNREYLVGTLGVSEDKLRRPRSRVLLTKGGGVLEGRTRWLRERLALSGREARRAVQKTPEILDLRPDANLAPKLDYLKGRLSLDDAALRRLVLRNPGILLKSSLDGVAPKLDWLQRRLGLDDGQASRMIRRFPTILEHSIAEKLEPTLEWLEKRLSLTDEGLSRILRRMPNLFSCSVDDNLALKFNWVKQRLHLHDEAVSDLIRRYPPILGCSISDKLKPTLDWIQRRLLLSHFELAVVVQRMPSLVGYSVATNMEPTLNFYIQALDDEEKAITLLVEHPVLLGASLDKRLKPRLEQGRKIGLTIDVGCMRRIGKYTDKQWEASIFRRVGRKPAGGL